MAELGGKDQKGPKGAKGAKRGPKGQKGGWKCRMCRMGLNRAEQGQTGSKMAELGSTRTDGAKRCKHQYDAILIPRMWELVRYI